MGPWLTESAGLQLVADLMKQEVEALEPKWKRLTVVALNISQADIAGVLRGKAFTADQLDSMKDAERLGIASSQFLYRLGKLATGLADYFQGAVDDLDMREFLAEMFTVPDEDGDAAIPGSTTVGGIGHGMSTAGDAIIEQQRLGAFGSQWDILNQGG